MKKVLLLAVIFMCIFVGACDNGDSGGDSGSSTVSDNSNPIPGGSGILSISGIATDSITITWTSATDNVSTNLQYMVVFSENNDIATLEDAENNGSTAMDWTENETTAQISGLETCWSYYINVFVKDENNNSASYTVLHSWTKAPCPPFATGQITLFAAGDDGDLEMGESWPNPRFSDNGDGTVADNLTGLVWQKVLSTTAMNWEDAIDYANTSTLAGNNDWRLPNILELNSLCNSEYGNIATWLSSYFTGVQSGFYFSSTSYTALSTQALGLFMSGGNISQSSKTGTSYVIIVRGNSNLPKTGQVTSYETGDDGDYEKGVSWPSPRFINNGDGTVIDRLTGLMWEQSPDGTEREWESGLSYISGLTTGGFSDWRMPNKNEMYSLVTFKAYEKTFEWLNTSGFSNVESSFYQSGTTSASDSTRSYLIYFYNSPAIEARPKTVAQYSYIWAVRQ